jgi:sec-independent protein translocase protein TatA
VPLLAGLGPLGAPELIIVLVIVVLIFGVGRLPDVGGAVGKSIREFRKATKDPEEHETTVMTSTDAPVANGATKAGSDLSAAQSTVFCGECGTKNVGTAKFCANCGHAISTPVA